MKKPPVHRFLLETYRKINPVFLLRSVLIDSAFFILFAIIYTLFFFRISEKMTSINLIVSNMGGSIASMNATAPTQESYSALLSQKEVMMDSFKSLMAWIFGLFLFVFLLWLIFQGMNWHLAHKHHRIKDGIAKIKNLEVSYLNYMKNMGLMSFLLALIFVVLILLAVKVSSKLSFRAFEIIDDQLLIDLAAGIFIIVLYFAFVSYSVLDKSFIRTFKRTFIDGIKKSKFYIIIYALMILKILLVIKIITMLDLDIIGAVILGMLLVIIITAWARSAFVSAGRIE